VLDHPQMAEPAKRSTMAQSSAGLRPQISATVPYTGATAALVSRYAEPIHTEAVEDRSWLEMDGSAVVMMEKSSAARNRVNW
jgi:hypothetical protein